MRYYNDFVQSQKKYRIANENETLVLKKVSNLLSTLSNDATPEEIQKRIYDIGMESGYENLRDYFQMLYEVLLGQTQGPRFGSFVALYGMENSKKLIDQLIS